MAQRKLDGGRGPDIATAFTTANPDPEDGHGRDSADSRDSEYGHGPDSADGHDSEYGHSPTPEESPVESRGHAPGSEPGRRRALTNVNPRGRPPTPPATSHPMPDQPRWLPREDAEVPPRPALTRRRIVLTALGLVEEHGLDALTMRRVSSALQVTPMSLYNHVSDKAELVDLMVDYIIGDVVAKSMQDTGDWEAKLRAQTRRNHQMWKNHPGFVRVYTQGVNMGPNGLANTEWAIRNLRDAGFSEEEAGGAVLMLYRWSMATLLIASTRPVSRNQDIPSRPARSKQDRFNALFSALPIEAIPNIVATAPFLTGTSIEFGLDIIVAGLKAVLATKGTGGDGADIGDAATSENSTRDNTDTATSGHSTRDNTDTTTTDNPALGGDHASQTDG